MSKKKLTDSNEALQLEKRIQELIDQGFIERVKSNGSAYFVITEKGLDLYDKLSKSTIIFTADFDVDEPTKH
jgi:predicted transcriptional regulator|tara:strand:+ start:9 stop:224 length:216 start_codon:yes stop_codon:yes gene_type:complete